jgi:hypothetical protein
MNIASPRTGPKKAAPLSNNDSFDSPRDKPLQIPWPNW